MSRIIPIILAMLVFLPALLPAQQAKTAAVPVAGTVFMIQGEGGNIGVIADPAGMDPAGAIPAGSILIDSMYERSAVQIRAALRGILGGENIRFLVNTHWHGDHTDGNKAFGPGSVIVAHENIRAMLAKPQNLMGQKTDALPAGALPVVTFSDRLTLYAGDIAVRLIHYPHAHTDGDTVVFVDRYKVLHMGDMFFNGLFPFLDVANGGNIDSWVKQLDAILAWIPADTKIIPGHGPVGGPTELKAFRQMLADSADIVRRQMKEGKTLDQIKAAGLPDRFAPWTKGFLPTPQWLELVYSSLAKK